MPGLLADADMIGAIVWAPDPVAGVHWPGEVFDPLAPTTGRQLPEGAAARLTPAQRRASLPCDDGSHPPELEVRLAMVQHACTWVVG